MALDRQKILSDLGNVMNQLQSADCGCMGKLFSNSGQGQGMGAPAYGGQQGCWHNQQSYGHPCSGEPYSMNQQAMPAQGRPCMGYCNPPKLYADTYGYLNQNLMQPVVREVYDDLKSICPANAVMNDALGSQMGLSQGATKTPVVRGNMGQIAGQTPMGDVMGGQNAMQGMGGMPAGNTMNSMPMGGQEQQTPMGGMGTDIVNMMMKSNKRQPMNMAGQGGQQQGGEMNAHMGANQGQYATNMGSMGGNQAQLGSMAPNAVQYNAGNMGASHYNNTGNMGANQGQHNAGNMGANQAQYYAETGMANMTQGNAMRNPTTQYMTQSNTYPADNAQANAIPNMGQNAQMGNMNANPGGQQMPVAQRGNYGIHGQGVAKFNEMFPGVMQGLGGNLEFDPMSIAIQMNPANKQHATMGAMQKLMSSNDRTPVNQPQVPQQQVPQQQVPQQQVPQQQVAQQQVAQQQMPQQQVPQQQVLQQQQQIVNTAVTDARAYQQAPQQQLEEQTNDYQEQLQPQQIRDSGAVNLPGGGYPNQITPNTKEPIYPVDTSRNQISTGGQRYEYNTLGQPIESLPTNSYRHTEPNLPQTLSPQPVPTRLRNEPMRYSNVKSTISKTSLFGNRAIGKTPSRNQLQQVYNQYKGSHSYTNQNIRTPVQEGREQHTASDGRLNVNRAPQLPRLQVPVEKVGGDTIANSQAPNEQVTNKVDHRIAQSGDVAANKPQGDTDQSISPVKNGRLRNGLQDMVFTSYPQSAAWTFHGHNDPQPYSAYRYRNRV